MGVQMNKSTFLQNVCVQLKNIMGDKACFDVIDGTELLFSDGLELTSLEYMQLIITLEDKYNCKFNENVWEYKNIKKVEDLLNCLTNLQFDTDDEKTILSWENDESFLFHKIIERNSNLLAGHIALMNENVTYEELWTSVKMEINRLNQTGLKKGEKVFFYLPNSIEFVQCFFACAYLGIVMVLGDTKWFYELDDIFQENSIRHVFVNNETIKRLKSLEALERIKLDGITIDCVEKTGRQYENTSIEINEREIKPSDKIIILYTSGSEGKPKGVVNTYENITEALKNYCRTVQFNCNDIVIGAIPFFHSYGMGSCLLAGFASGASMILMDAFYPHNVIKSIIHYRATIFQGVPYMYKMINHFLEKNPSDVSSLRICISAAGKMNVDDVMAFYKLTGKTIHQEYGSTETGTIAFSRAGSLNTNLDCVGSPLDGVKVKIQDVDGTRAGRIVISSKSIALGYMDSNEFTKENYETGDIGYIDEYDRIVLSGREKRMINISGVKVNAYEVEEIINRHPKVELSYVFGVESLEFGEEIKAIVVKKDETLRKKELIAFCRKRLSTYKVPKYIEWREQMELSNLGKVKESNEREKGECKCE